MKHRPGCPCAACAPARRACDVDDCDAAATHVPQLTLGDSNGKRLAMPKATIGLLLCAAHRDKRTVRRFARSVPGLSRFEALAVDFVTLDARVARELERVRGGT